MTPSSPTLDAASASDLLEAIASGQEAAVKALLEAGADPNASIGRGLCPLYVACAGGHAALLTVLTAPFTVELSEILCDEATLETFGRITTLLLGHGARPNERSAETGVTPLMLARYFGQREAARVLLEHGADAALRDGWSRGADRHAVFQSIARLIRLCEGLPAVKAAYLADLHLPASEQFTSPLIGLELTGALPPDAFATWPASEPALIFAVSGDPVSKLMKLSEPVYRASTLSTSREMANAVARAIGGRAYPLVGDSESAPVGVSLPEGRIVLLIRKFYDAFSIDLQQGEHFHVPAGVQAESAIPEIAARTLAWGTEHPQTVTILESAFHFTRALTLAFGERWEVSIPGTVSPSEMWLHGPNRNAGAVGVFGGHAVVWAGGEGHQSKVWSRQTREAAAKGIVQRVREQKARYARNVETSRRIRAFGERLGQKLSQSLPAPGSKGWMQRVTGTTTHDSAERFTLAYEAGNHDRDIVRISADEDRIRVHAGLFGALGFEAELNDLEEVLPGIVSALQKSLVTLTVKDLEPGQRYRVLEAIQGLKAGTVVEYRGFNDIDNHYGEYDFRAETGEDLAVGGDCSSERSDPLREVHRYLERVKN